MRFGVSADSWHASSHTKENLIEMSTALPAAKDGQAGCLWKFSLGNMATKMVAHPTERLASYRFAETEAVQDGYSSRHQAFTAHFLFWKAEALEDLHLETTSPHRIARALPATPPPEIKTSAMLYPRP
jgi:hypothetical protein